MYRIVLNISKKKNGNLLQFKKEIYFTHFRKGRVVFKKEAVP